MGTNLGFVRIIVFFISVSCFSQIKHPKASPLSKVEQQIGLSKITVEYSRPSVRGRHVFGPQPDGQKGLVPYGRIWRVGANASTKISVNPAMEIGGNLLPKGTFALYAFPNQEVWEIVLHANTRHWGDGREAYNPDDDVFRIEIEPQTIPYHQENLLITFDSISHNTAVMDVIWANTKVSIPLRVDTDAQMELEIARQIRENPTAQTYYEAARYLQEQGKDFERALVFLDKALQIGGDTYYFHRVKSVVLAHLGKYENAIVAAEKSLELAKAQNKDEFVRMNQKNIKLWGELLKNQ